MKERCQSCSSAFARKADLKKHQEIHDGIKSYQCIQCESSFRYKNKLTRHIESVHEKRKPFVCECGVGFTSKQNLYKHIEKTHEYTAGPSEDILMVKPGTAEVGWQEGVEQDNKTY